jgi:hypothetical protein
MPVTLVVLILFALEFFINVYFNAGIKIYIHGGTPAIYIAEQ